MEKEKMNNFLLSGITLNVIYLFTNRFNNFPDFFSGLLVGIAITLMLTGICLEKNTVSKNRNITYNNQKTSNSIKRIAGFSMNE